MNVFLINLEKNKERLHSSDRQLSELGVRYVRFPAIYGKALSEEEKRTFVNRFRAWCANGRKLSDGEIGCALSHLGIYRKMLELNIPVACVLEDDVVLSKSFGRVLDAVGKLVDLNEPQVVLLSDHTGRDEVAQHEEQLRSFETDCFAADVVKICPIQSDICMEAYVITLQAARAVLGANYPVVTPSDEWRRWRRLGLIQLYHSVPTVATQDWTSGTDVCEGIRRLDFWAKIRYKMVRLIGLSIDRLLNSMGKFGT